GLRPERRTELLERPVAVRARDPRVFPYLVAGFGLFSALGLIQILIGFLIQDRFALTGEQTGIATGGTMLGAGIGMVIAQAVIVPKIRFSPPALIRLGAPIAMLGFLAILVDLPLWSLVTAVFLVGVGMGIATPGYMAGPTLRVRPDEQGGLAGLIGATNGLTFVVTPTAGTALYALWQPLPMIAGAALLGTVALLAFLHPAFRTSAGPGVPAGPEAPDEAALP
ncbi:MFS transporter, partial [Leucobacter sp. M11]|uniref:MFS transporter n=1 Tax=Leucobacter sp. M11 TaxID=2993565 RepID=UPI002D7F7041